MGDCHWIVTVPPAGAVTVNVTASAVLDAGVAPVAVQVPAGVARVSDALIDPPASTVPAEVVALSVYCVPPPVAVTLASQKLELLLSTETVNEVKATTAALVFATVYANWAWQVPCVAREIVAVAVETAAARAAVPAVAEQPAPANVGVPLEPL